MKTDKQAQYLKEFKEAFDEIKEIKRFMKTAYYRESYEDREKTKVKARLKTVENDLDFYLRNIKWF